MEGKYYSGNGNGKGEAEGLPFENPEVSYEHSDVNIGAIIKFGAGLVIAGIIINFIAWGLFHYFSNREDRLEPPAPPLASSRADRLPPEPRLQGAPGSKFPLQSPMKEMDDYRKTEDELLKSYGWVDQKAGLVRIPIERAKQLLLERGFPVRTGQPAASSPAQQGTTAPAAPSETRAGSKNPERSEK